MSLRTLGVGSVLLAAALAGSLPSAAAEEPALRVMTFNLRYASPDGPHAWPVRRPLVAGVLRDHAPDLIGTQEGLWGQLNEIAEDAPEYAWIGLGREGGSRGEFMAVFYKRARLEALAFDHFWLSETPERVGSLAWGATLPRMVTWVRLRDRASGREFVCCNTHFDHRSQLAREKSGALLAERIATQWADDALLLLGDFNAEPLDAPPYATLRAAGLSDAWEVAAEHSELSGTFHGFSGPSAGQSRIDWVLFRGPFRSARAAVVADGQDGEYPSDHFPVVVDLEWTAGD